MNIKDVAKLSPMNRFLYWIKERHQIYLKKESEKAPPWTDDEILQSYRFCNVRRMDDKVSQWLYNNWYKPNYNHKNMVLAVVLARHFNLPSCLSVVRFPKIWSPERILLRIKKLDRRFNGAYVITPGVNYSSKSDTIIKETVQQFVDNPLKIDTSSIEITTQRLIKYRNIGSFMAGQITCDLRQAVKGSWRDKFSWAAVGPGSSRGMNRLQLRNIKKPIIQSVFSDELRELMYLVKRKLLKMLTERLEAIDYQNCLCEFDKYERVLHGEGKPKQKYPGGTSA